jgi:hypothetical protein
MNICIHCGAEFVGRPERPNKYCSNECHFEHNKKIQVQKICGVCGKEFIGNENRQFCSVKCVHASMRQEERPCVGCGKLFAPEKTRTKYCSKECEIQSKRIAPEPPPVSGARWISLTQGKFALIDEEDFKRVSQHAWCSAKGRSTWYAKSYFKQNGTRRSIKLHQFILSPKSGVLIDHKDQNGLNCRKENLRPATEAQNRMNTMKKLGQTKYKGVAILPNGKFRAMISYDNNYKYLGSFRTPEEAARVYDAKAREVHGANGRYNFPEPGELPARRE